LPKYRDFCDFQDGGRRHLGFSKIRNFNGLSPVGADMRHHAKFHQNQTVAEIWQFNGFQNGGSPPSWICSMLIWTIFD